MKRWHWIGCCLCIAFAAPAQAAPLAASLTVPNSTLLLSVDALGAITATANLSLTGTQGIELNDDFPVATKLTLGGGSLAIADNSLTLDLGALGSIGAGLVGAVISGFRSDGQLPLQFTGVDSFAFDPGDDTDPTETILDVGLLTYQGTGPFGSLLGDGTIDFSSYGARFLLYSIGPLGTLTRSVVGTSGGMTTYGLALAAPISTERIQLDDPAPDGIFIQLQGMLFATGTYVVAVPEPSTICLVGLGLLALIPFVRRPRPRSGRPRR
ncbi:MAG: PEP-CTERM sorting domain-containing protein [Pirellulales bacterium]|nr:PEP-CTERM sorting domain-containing protein [Pirellulales bacterium]